MRPFADPIHRYMDHVRRTCETDPERGWRDALIGFRGNTWGSRHLPNFHAARGYHKLEAYTLGLVSDQLGHESNYVWGNVFAPVEIMECFGLGTVSVECLASFFSGYHAAPYFIDRAQESGIASTLCTYHKTVMGMMETGVLHAPRLAVTTSCACDGNLSTFRQLGQRMDVPMVLLDVPYDNDDASIDYLADQLRELARTLEKLTGTPFDESRLSHLLEVERETNALAWEFICLQAEHFYPAEFIHHLFFVLAMQLSAGSEELRDLLRFMVDDIKRAPRLQGDKILWVHLMPYYQQSLKAAFDYSPAHQIVAVDMAFCTMSDLADADPFRALAKKLVGNAMNGPYERKLALVDRLLDATHADGVIHFCHWGCKQSSGGSALLREHLHEAGVPLLQLDGDGIDERNSHDGQIKTRLEAFFEVLEAKRAEGAAQGGNVNGESTAQGGTAETKGGAR